MNNNLKQMILKLFPINRKKIIFNNFNGKGYGDNPKYIADRIMEKKLPYKLVWIVSDINEEIPDGIKKVRNRGIMYCYQLATSRLIVNNVRNYLGVEKKKGQIYLQTWHGPYSLKCVEKEAEDKLEDDYVQSAKHDGDITDAIIAGDLLQKKQFEESFWLNKNTEILEFGLPRNDYLVNNVSNKDEIRRIKKKYGIGQSQTVILYAPTFRDDDSLDGYRMDFEKVLVAFEEKLDRECIMIVRLHPNVSSQVDFITYNKKIINGTNASNIQELSLISDYLISDYSTSFFDFTLLKRPAFILALDLESYKKNRGLLKSYDNLPFPFAKTNEELIENIHNFDKVAYDKELSSYLKKYPIYDKGIATEKVVNWIVNII